MNILIAGASGFIGKALTKALSPSHQLTVLGRDLKRLSRRFPTNITKVTWNTLEHHDAKQYDLILNLSGSNIGEKRWSKSIKEELIHSRTSTNQALIDWLEKHKASPRFFCANAVGIYGMQNDDSISFDEDTPIDILHTKDFLNEIGVAWQQSLQPAIDQGIEVTTLRFGVVLKKKEGMLKKLEFPFFLGLGSILGDGKQVISWVHYQDLISAIIFLIENPHITGPINITSPNPVSQKAFATCFAKVLHRPLFLKMPRLVIRLLFGEMGECLLLKGQRVLPKRLTELGFKFNYPELGAALEEEYKVNK